MYFKKGGKQGLSQIFKFSVTKNKRLTKCNMRFMKCKWRL
jgi:hypothetical protein